MTPPTIDAKLDAILVQQRALLSALAAIEQRLGQLATDTATLDDLRRDVRNTLAAVLNTQAT